MQDRIDRLVAALNGAIKYRPMLQDNPDWTDEQCLAFARQHHATAIARLRAEDPLWNAGIPYCRNVPTPAMIEEARNGGR
jgi:hypothetical protein